MIIGAIAAIASGIYQGIQAGQAANARKKQYKQQADVANTDALQTMVDAYAAAQRKLLIIPEQTGTARSLLAKAGADASVGSALAVQKEDAGKIAWEAALIMQKGSEAFWGKKMQARGAEAASQTAESEKAGAVVGPIVSGVSSALSSLAKPISQSISTGSGFSWLT